MRLEWRNRTLEDGLDRGVLYLAGSAVPWNGLISVAEKDSSQIIYDQFLDGIRYMIVQNLGDFEATIESIGYPKEILEHDLFGFSYRVNYGDGYKLHLVYDATFQAPQLQSKTLAASGDPDPYSIVANSVPDIVAGSARSSHLVFDTTAYPEISDRVTDILYGTDTTEPRLPTPDELRAICESAAVLSIIQNLDGTWTATAPDDILTVNADGSFTITAPSANPYDENSFVVTSY